MALVCPHCSRSLSDSAEPSDRPLFCMYCGHRLAAVPAVEPSGHTATFHPSDHEVTAGYAVEVGDIDVAATRAVAAEPTDPHPAATDAAPAHIGGYRLVRFIGGGGMGNVYEGEARDGGESVAVKLLSRKLASNPASVERFRQEGRLASQITHPRCVFVLRADTEAGRPFIVMELMPGRTLKDVVDERGPLPVQDAVVCMLDVVEGLAEAHRLGVIHRDVKPSNCFLAADGRVKVGDFGLSKSLGGSDAERQLTHSGTFLGTVLFAPPEQIRHEPVGYDSDVYSACATLYYLLTGRAPHQHESLTAVLARAVSEAAPPIRPRRPDVPRELEQIVLRGLERDRGRRYQSLEDLRAALLELLPSSQAPAGVRALSLAYVVDQVLLFPLSIIAQVAAQFALPDMTAWWVSPALHFVYFALAEGLFGATVGKRLLRLKVVRLGESGPPGLPRAALRTLVFRVMLSCVGALPILAEIAKGRINGGVIFALGMVGFVGGLAALLLQVRRSTHGHRGVHDFAAGTRVVQRTGAKQASQLVSPYAAPLDSHLPTPVPLPKLVGAFHVTGKLCDVDDGGQVWVGEDRSLGRRVVLRVEPPGSGDDSAFDEPVVRPTRLRVLGHGTLVWGGGDRAWAAYVAPSGAPLPDVVSAAKPLGWADARTVLEQLVGELIDADADDSLPPVLSPEQVWVEPGGRVQLLDFPLPTGQAVAAGETKSRYPARSADPLTFVKQMAALTLEGVPRSTGGRVRAPLPPRAMGVTADLFADRFDDLRDVRAALKDTHQAPPATSTGLRVGHLTLQALRASFGLLLMFVVCEIMPLGSALGRRFEAFELAQAIEGIETPAQRREVRDKLPKGTGHRVEAGVAGARRSFEFDWDALANALKEENAERTLAMLRARVDRVAESSRHGTNPPEAFLVDWTVEHLPLSGDAKPNPTYLLSAVLQAEDSGEPEEERKSRGVGMIILAFLLCMCPLFFWPIKAMLFRGGLSYWFAGLTLVRQDGRPAEFWRCGLRELLVWLPPTVTLAACLLIQWVLPGWVVTRTTLWLLAAAMLPVMVLLTLREPVRGPHDRIVGTTVVPR